MRKQRHGTGVIFCHHCRSRESGLWGRLAGYMRLLVFCFGVVWLVDQLPGKGKEGLPYL